jgi:hypothetical protein
MLSGHRSARRRGRNSRVMRIAVPLAIPMALGLTLGIVLAVSGGNPSTINQSALGSCSGATAAQGQQGNGFGGAGRNGGGRNGGGRNGGGRNGGGRNGGGRNHSAQPTATASATATPCATASASGSATESTTTELAQTFASGPVATQKLGDVANAPVSGAAGATPIVLDQTAAEAANSMNCTLEVPNNPLTTRGLETPYQLGDGCSMANASTEGAFVEATILSPNGQLTVYNPLVITAGTTPAATPAAAPALQRGSEVIIDIGFNGNNLALTGQGANQGNCVDALGESLIGQVSGCNTVNFYNLANSEIERGILHVPALGTDDSGQTCLSTREFALIDQDQSDNVISQYLINGNGQTEQDTAANANADAADTLVANGSDDRLLADFVDPANGCTPFTATDTTNSEGTSGSQALNELSARVNAQSPIAETPVNDEMALVDGNFSVAKTNVYRSLVDQSLLQNNVNATDVAADYCQNMVNLAPERNETDMARELNFTSPVPATGDNLATFMGARLSASFMILGCANFGLTNPVNVTLNGDGVATAVSYTFTQQEANTSGTTATAAPTATATPTSGGDPYGTNPFMRKHHEQNSAGM